MSIYLNIASFWEVREDSFKLVPTHNIMIFFRMITISVCLIKGSIQQVLSTSLVLMVIATMFKGCKIFCKYLIYKQTVLKVKEVFEFDNFQTLIRNKRSVMCQCPKKFTGTLHSSSYAIFTSVLQLSLRTAFLSKSSPHLQPH